jgi:hypothetical protein
MRPTNLNREIIGGVSERFVLDPTLQVGGEEVQAETGARQLTLNFQMEKVVQQSDETSFCHSRRGAGLDSVSLGR